VIEFLSQQGVVVVECGDCGCCCIEAAGKFGALAGLGCEGCAKRGDFVVLAGFPGCEPVAGGDPGVPVGEDLGGPVHGRAADARFFPPVFLDQASVGVLRLTGEQPGVTRKSIAGYAYELIEEGSLKARTTSWAPDDGGIVKKTLAKHWTGLSAGKNKLSGN
jgi:hypothetical protein